jgi:pimeloyl-ACP methyl ester carboxylesterase
MQLGRDVSVKVLSGIVGPRNKSEDLRASEGAGGRVSNKNGVYRCQLRRESDEHDYSERWYDDLLQRLGQGPAIVFSHGWPLRADDWDGQMLFSGQRGYRGIAHDRRGHGRSTQTWDGNETDFTEDLKKFDVPTLILHGDDDQIVPIGAAALRSSKLVKNATLKVYPGFPHGMPTTHADQINADLLEFF